MNFDSQQLCTTMLYPTLPDGTGLIIFFLFEPRVDKPGHAEFISASWLITIDSETSSE
jgi:hypothetical protein